MRNSTLLLSVLILTLHFLLLIACNTPRPTLTASKDEYRTSVRNRNAMCSTKAKVVDYTAAGGCGLLIQTEKGQLLVAAQIADPNFKLEVGQILRIGYQPIEGMQNPCNMTSIVSDLKCVEVVGKDLAPRAACIDTSDPMTVTWMREKAAQLQANEIKKYPYLNGYAYLFKGSQESNLLDCQGNLVCTYSNTAKNNDAQRKISMMQNGKVVYNR